MGSVTDIRNGLAARMETIDGITGYARPRGTINVPAAVIEPGPIAFDSTMGRGSDDLSFTIVLLLADSVADLAQEQLDPYLAGSGDQSVKAAVEADETLGGAADYACVTGVSDYGDVQWSGKLYLGARFNVEVNTDGT